MNLNCGCVLKYFVLVYSGLCWVLNKICRFKCGNNTKTETAFKKKNRALGLGSYQKRSKKGAFGLGCSQNRGQKGIEFKKKKKPIWPRVQQKPRPKGYRICFFLKKRPIWPRVQSKPRQKAGSMASGAVKIEAEGPSMASVLNRGQKPQYASVPEPVQNIKNNRCQRPLLHWCNNDDWMLVYLFIKKKEKSNITYYSYYPMTYCSIQWLVIKRKL